MCAKPSSAGLRKKIAAATHTPKKVDVKPLKVIWMTPAQWHAVPANPYQKANRAKRTNIEHLRHFVEEHATVRMGIYPDGKRCKIDAHTRDDIWTNRPWLVDFIPARLRVECYEVADDEEAAARFRRCDNKKTAKNAADDVHGSFRLQGIPTESRFFQSASNIKSPLQYAYEIVVASTNPPGVPHSLKAATIDDYVIMFKDALVALDAINVNRSRLSAPFITAFLLAYTKHGEDVLPFFIRVNEGTHGRRDGKLMCPIAAIEQKRDKWDSGGRTEHFDLVVQVLGALDTFMQPAGFRDPSYQPKVDMQKIMEVDLDHYLLRAKAKRTGRTLSKRMTR
jgi:hypothetical protein